jgi:branched-chain amino acid transport system ATP-binding protein
VSTNGQQQPLLRLEGINTYYGQMHILQNVDLHVGPGELVCLLGGNASGKSTTLKTILGIVPPRTGSVVLDGRDVTRASTARRIELGLAIVPENRRLFGPMTVLENLEMGAYLRPRADLREDLERVYSIFPLLSQRRKQLAGTLSGGEQQMLALARGLMLRPRLLLLDEPSLGLAPLVVREIFRIVRAINADERVSVLLVEQNASLALDLARHAYLLETGRVIASGPAADLKRDDAVRRSYLGY